MLEQQVFTKTLKLANCSIVQCDKCLCQMVC